MKRFRLRAAASAVGLALAAAVYASVVAGSAPAAVKPAATVKSTTITVVAGKPSELAFTLSKYSLLPAGTFTFKVTNMGVAYHDFELCTAPVANATKNSCVGKLTPILHHGQSATLTVTLKNGKYEFLCSVTGHAAAGMKGLLGVGVAVTQPAVPVAKTTTTKTTTNTTPNAAPPPPPVSGTTTTHSGGGGGGAPNPCANGTIQTSGNSDADGDEAGTEPDDGDGCI